MNFLPYLRLPTTKGYLNILVDTGANKSYLNPEHVNKAKSVKQPAVVRNKNGNFKIDKMVHVNLFPEAGDEKLPFHVFRFHKFFDGLLGYENLAILGAKINTKNHALIIESHLFPFSRYHVNQIHFNEQRDNLFEITTTANGSFLIEEKMKLSKNVTLTPGVYLSKNNKAVVHLETNKSNIRCTLPPFACEHFSMTQENKEVKLNFTTTHLNAEEKRLLGKTLKDYKDVFFNDNDKLTFTHEVKHNIKTSDENPIHQKTYKYPYHLRDEVSTQIQKMLGNGIIRESSSQWTSPIWVVPKKMDNSGKRKYRIVVDYRKLNEKTPADRYPIPEISEILDRLGKAQYFTVLDLASGFHQIEVNPKDIPKTAFNVDNGKYEYVRMPFGLKNAPATFQRLMDSVLRKHIGIRCFVYMDDIIIYSIDLQTHLGDIKKILQTLREANLKIQCDKSEFLRKEVEFLGHLVTTDGVRPNPQKIEAIKSWPLPMNRKALQSFLGTISYYRRFIPNFSHIAKPMTSQLRNGNKNIDVNAKYEETFEKLKAIMTSDLLLTYPNYDKPFILTTDASNVAIGAVLAQLDNGIERPIAYLSRTLSRAEENYSATAKELLAIYFAAKTFRSYLYGKQFTIYTDHEPLTKELKLTDATGRVTRQRLYLEQFDFKIIYKKGKQNVVADGLSRIPKTEVNNHEMENEVYENDKIYGNHPINRFKNQIFFRVTDNQRKSPYLLIQIFPGYTRHIYHRANYDEERLIGFLKEHINPNASNGIFAPLEVAKTCARIANKHFRKKIKIEYCNLKLPDIIDPKEQEEFIKKSHNFNHRNYKIVYEEASKSVFFPELHRKLRDFSKNCEDCRLAKYERHPFKIPITRRMYNRPFDNVYMDVFVKETEKFLTIVDAFSKFAQLYKIENEQTETIIETLTRYFSTFGVPKQITCDQATSFRNPTMTKFLTDLNIFLHFASTSNSNGIIERFHNTLIEMYQANQDKTRNLNLYEGLKLIVALYNETKHSSTKIAPREIIYGTSNSLNRLKIVNNQTRTIQTALDNIELHVNNKNSKILCLDEEEYRNLQNKNIYTKCKGKASLSNHRYRKANIVDQTLKTITDQNQIKTHKKHLKRIL